MVPSDGLLTMNVVSIPSARPLALHLLIDVGEGSNVKASMDSRVDADADSVR